MLSATAHTASSAATRAFAHTIARAATRSLYVELTTTPKPGLVCPGDNGSHPDMAAATLLRSLFALRHYFHAVTAAAARAAPFTELQRLGIAAESRMLAATGGVNAHRGAIFNIGLLAAACGDLYRRQEPLTPGTLSRTVRARWSPAICEMRPLAPSHGLAVAARYGAGGARLEAARGYPSIFDVALPAFRQALHSGLTRRRALVQTLFALIAHLEDTNLLHRGGLDGLRFARTAAKNFLARGGTTRPDWETCAYAIRDDFVARNLSPGGAADLLAATWFAHTVTS